MVCKNCGKEINEKSKFCNNCGAKIVSDIDTMSDELKSRLAMANHEANNFLSKGKHTVTDYNQVCLLFAKAEQIGAHIDRVWIDNLDFFIKANLKNAGVYFDSVRRFEKVYDEFIEHILATTKTDKESIVNKYNKEEIIEEFSMNLKRYKKKSATIILVVIAICLLPLIIISFNGRKNRRFYTKTSGVSNINNIEEQQKREKIEKTLSDFAREVRTYNGGSVKYESYSKYSSIDNENIYKIKYKTSSEYSYYYQLVLLDDDNETIKKSTRLFSFYKYYGEEESGEKLELEYAFEKLCGNRT